jgi:outer membrane protein, heavy metal efflux system
MTPPSQARTRLRRSAPVWLLFLIVAIGRTGLADAASIDLERLTLANARALMLERNRELRLARHAVESAAADVTIAGARPNPMLNAGASHIGPASGPDNSPLYKRMDASIGISQLFERGRKRELRVQAAEYAAAAVRGDGLEVERQQRLAVEQTYYDLVLAQERQRIAAETAALFDKTIDAAERRVKSGDLARADLARLSVDALRARNEVELARQERAKAQVSLAYLLGVESDAPRIEASETWPEVGASQTFVPIEQAIERRPDVQAAVARVQQANRNRDLAQSLRTRDVTAGVQFDRTPNDTVRNGVGFSVSVPLFTSYYYQGEIRRAESEFDAAQTSLERVRAAAMTEVAAATAVLTSTGERVRRFQQNLLTAASQASDAAEFAYTRGAIGVMDLLDARRQLYATRLEAVNAIADYARAYRAWIAATETVSGVQP